MDYFAEFGRLAEAVSRAADLLQAILANPQSSNDTVQQVRHLEHEADEVARRIKSEINRVYVTPLDREDIHALTSSLDDVLDFVWCAADRVLVYQVSAAPPESLELSRLIAMQCEELTRAVRQLRDGDAVLAHCDRIGNLERDADHVVRQALGRIMEQEQDPITVIKLKDLCEALEEASDSAENAADVLESIVLKNQ